jgi:plastocyanin
MNKVLNLLFFAACGFLVSLPMACNNSTSTSAASATPTPTTVGLSATVNATAGDVFSPASVTITHGGAVTFAEIGGSHTLVIDNGSGTCVQNFTTWPQVVTFAAAGTYSFHCTIHSSCTTTTTCTGCTGMVGQVIVQ